VAKGILVRFRRKFKFDHPRNNNCRKKVKKHSWISKKNNKTKTTTGKKTKMHFFHVMS